ncbi:MAG: carboxypeptidase regulatory-like domain-containing protein [Planctomycetes bacterium]|nr:carboxypeptidase regulatory-like domain-containing protein [Planctomycetota bacterium]
MSRALLFAIAITLSLGILAGGAAYWLLVDDSAAREDPAAAADPDAAESGRAAARGASDGDGEGGGDPARDGDPDEASLPALRIRVLDARGDPVPGASIRYTLRSGGRGRSGHLPTTDAEGCTRMRAPPPSGLLALEVVPSERGTARREVDLEAGVDEIRLVLAPVRRLEGRVSLAGGSPASGAQVAAAKDGDGVQRVVTADADGRFALLALEEGRWSIEAVSAGHRLAGNRDVVIHRAALDEPLEIVLLEESTIAGRVLDGAGKPLAGARVALEGPRDRREALTSDAGEFVLAARPGVSYRLGAQAAGFAAAPQRDGVVGGTRHDIILARGGEIRGRIEMAGEPRPGAGAEIELRRLGAGPVAVEGTVAPDGSFTLRSVAPGSYELRAFGRAFTFASAGPIEVEGTGDAPLALLRVAASPDLVVDVVSEQGHPLGGAAVSCRYQGEAAFTARRIADAGGQARFPRLPAGSYVLEARAEQHESRATRIEWPAAVSGPLKMTLRMR